MLSSIPQVGTSCKRKSSNLLPPGDKLLFKSEYMPVSSPTMSRDRGGGFELTSALHSYPVLPDREQSSQICKLFTLYMNFF